MRNAHRPRRLACDSRGWGMANHQTKRNLYESNWGEYSKFGFFVKCLYNRAVDHISAHISKKVPITERATERGELMQYFRENLNRARVRDGLPLLSMPRMGRVLQAIPTNDLYYLKSVCDHAKDFSKKFWWEIKPKPDAHASTSQNLQPSLSVLLKKKVSRPNPRTHA